MKKVLIFVGALFISSPVLAEWKYIGSTDEEDYYLDLEQMRESGGFRYLWALTDNIKPKEDGDFSFTFYYELDCQRYGIRMLSFNKFDQHMGKGNITGSVSGLEQDFLFPSPQTIFGHFLKHSCE